MSLEKRLKPKPIPCISAYVSQPVTWGQHGASWEAQVRSLLSERRGKRLHKAQWTGEPLLEAYGRKKLPLVWSSWEKSCFFITVRTTQCPSSRNKRYKRAISQRHRGNIRQFSGTQFSVFFRKQIFYRTPRWFYFALFCFSSG